MPFFANLPFLAILKTRLFIQKILNYDFNIRIKGLKCLAFSPF